MGAQVFPVKNRLAKSNRPRCFHRGLLPTGNPQSENYGTDYRFEPRFFQALIFKEGCLYKRNPETSMPI
jgi:hypothetical protein